MTCAVALVLVARGIIAGVLAAAAIAKLRDPNATRAALRAARLPVSLDRTLPVIEAFTALGLLVERHTAWAAYVACALMAGFTAFVGVLVARGDTAPCPCFGAAPSAAPTSGRTLGRNIGLLAVAVLGTARATSHHWLIWAVAAVIGVVVLAAPGISARTGSGPGA